MPGLWEGTYNMNTMTGIDVGNEPEEGSPLVSMAPPSGAGELAALELVDGGFLDLLFDKVDAGELRLTGEGGFIPTMIKAVLERGLQVEPEDVNLHETRFGVS